MSKIQERIQTLTIWDVFCSRCFTVRHCSSCFLDIQDRGVKNAFRYLTSVHTKYFKITVQYLSRFARFVKFMNSCEFYAFCNEWIFMNLTNSWFYEFCEFPWILQIFRLLQIFRNFREIYFDNLTKFFKERIRNSGTKIYNTLDLYGY